MMEPFVRLLILLLLASTFTVGLEQPIRPHLTLVAAADGKSFFANNTLMGETDCNGNTPWYYETRNEASIFCRAIGMSLASITSKKQWDALDDAYQPEFFPSNWAHWTSAQDSLYLSQFRWEGQSSAIEGMFIKYRQNEAATRLTCLAFLSAPGKGTSQLIHVPCTAMRPVLCENKNE